MNPISNADRQPRRISMGTTSGLPDASPTVFVVDDDEYIREALETAIEAAGWRARTFASAELFLACPPASGASCLVLDVNMPGLGGLDLQTTIADERADMPIIFITGFGDIPTSVQAMKAGAVEFLTKPFDEQVLLDAIRAALERSQRALGDRSRLRELRERYAALTSREREVMDGVVSGRMNKQVGGDLGITEITVKKHRGRVMDKMRARSLAELVNMSTSLGLSPSGRR
jgi:FixJ family two-component response regulator